MRTPPLAGYPPPIHRKLVSADFVEKVRHGLMLSLPPSTPRDRESRRRPRASAPWQPCLFQLQITRCFYYFFMAVVVVVIGHKTKATARRALTFIVRIFVNDTIAIAVWTSFHVCLEVERSQLTMDFFCGRRWLAEALGSARVIGPFCCRCDHSPNGSQRPLSFRPS